MGSSGHYIEVADQPELVAKRRCQARCCSFLRKINAEPVILLSMTGYGLITTIMPLFLYWARCVQIFDNNLDITINITEFCQHLNEQNSTYLNIVERDIATWKIYLQLASSLPTFITAPILGAWADGTGGRKKPLIMSLLGLTIYGGLQVASTITYKTVPVYPLFILAEFIASLCGGMMILFATSFAMISDESREEMKHGESNVSVRMGIASALQMFGGIIGGITASLFIRYLPHEQSFIVGAFVGCLLLFVAAVYTVFFVQETHSKPAENEESAEHDHDHTLTNDLNLGFGKGCWKVIKAKGRNLIQVLIEKRAGWTRCCLNLSLLFLFVETFSFDGSLLLLIFKRPPFAWSDATWVNYSIFKGLMFSIGMIIIPALIAKTDWLGKDSILIISGTFVAAAISIIVSFAQSTELLFICAGIGFLTGGITPGFRSFIPRMVRKEETARLLTAFGIVVAVAPIVSATVFNSIFNATLTFWPAFVYLIAGILVFAVFVGLCIVHMLMSRLWLQQKSAGLESLEISDHASADQRLTNEQNT